MKRWLYIFCFVVLYGGFSIANAQTNSGSLAGSVVDEASRVIPRATLTITNTQTGVSSAAVTSSSGNYNVIDLIPGVYVIRASMPGFKTRVETNITIEANATTSVNITLQPGSVSQSITVEATNIGIQTESSSITSSVTSNLVQDLPLTNTGTQGGVRTPVSLIFLTPGVQGNLENNKIAGGQQEGSDVQVDGISYATSGGSYNAPLITPSVDATREFSVLTAGLPAEYGRTSGGIVSFVTKSGTNGFHGGAYDIIRNTAFDANSWFNNHYRAEDCIGINDTPACIAKYARPADQKNNFGVTLGGPVWIPHIYNGRDKTFFFFSWEQARLATGGLNVSTLPTTANRAGDFSQNLNTADVLVANNPCDNNNPIYAGEIFDPSTTQTINGVTCRSPFRYNGELNVMPPSTAFSQVAKNILGYVPAPDNDNIANNYTYPYTFPITTTLETIRIDHSFGENDKIFGSYNPYQFSGFGGTEAIPGPANATDTQGYFVHAGTFGYTHIFSPSLENSLIIGGYRYTNVIDATAVAAGIDFPQKLGIGNLSGATFPAIHFTLGGYLNLGFGENYFAIQSLSELNDSVSWTRGKHNLMFGYNLRRQADSNMNTGGSAGTFTFAPAETAGISTSITQNGNAFASFLIGQMSGASASVPLHAPRWTSWYNAIYAQDNFKISPTLMLNLGLRYSVDLPQKEEDDDESIFDPNTPNPGAGGLKGALIFAGTGPGRSGRSSRWVNATYGDIAPRVGFSWAPAIFNQRTAIRGSYGILYGAFFSDVTTAYTQAGFTAASSYTASNSIGGFSGTPFDLDKAYPALATTIKVDPSQLNGQPTYYAQRDAKPPMVQLWNLQIQQEIVPDLVFTLGYVGNHGTRLLSDLKDINAITPQYWALGSKLTQQVAGNDYGIPVPYAGFSGSIANALRPYPQYLHIAPAVESVGQSSYNALWATLQRRYRNGLTLLVSYTWSKTMTDADYVLAYMYGANGIQNPFDPHGERALSSEDRPNNLSLAYVYELPFGENKAYLNHSHILNALVGGWVIGGIQSYESYTPITFGCANQIPGTDNCVRWDHSGSNYLSNTANKANFNPDTDNYFLNPGQTVSQVWIDPEANLSNGSGYQLGNVTRYTTARGPFELNEDFSVTKSIPIKEGINMEIRGEFFNAFNRHQFAAPAGAPLNAGFGKVTATSDAQRQMQFTARIRF